jgi:hypothetical protein
MGRSVFPVKTTEIGIYLDHQIATTFEQVSYVTFMTKVLSHPLNMGCYRADSVNEMLTKHILLNHE